jgi:hypothetical protein
MLLYAQADEELIQFNLQLFEDEEKKRLLYLIKMADGAYVIAEKYPGINFWFQVYGHCLLYKKQQAVFGAIEQLDRQTIATLIRPLRLLDASYICQLV